MDCPSNADIDHNFDFDGFYDGLEKNDEQTLHLKRNPKGEERSTCQTKEEVENKQVAESDCLLSPECADRRKLGFANPKVKPCVAVASNVKARQLCPHGRLKHTCRASECKERATPHGGYSEKPVSDRAAVRQFDELEINALPLRNPGFLNRPDGNGRTLVNPGSTVLVRDTGMDGKCYYPALAMCTGVKKLFTREQRDIMRCCNSKVINSALEPQHRMTLVRRQRFNTKPLQLLREDVGMYMVAGASGGFDHWIAFDAYRGVLYGGQDNIILIDASDRKDKTTALDAFKAAGLDSIKQVYLVIQLPPPKVDKKQHKKHKRMAFTKTTTKRHATQHKGGAKRAGPCHTESAPALIYPGIGYDEELTSVLKSHLPHKRVIAFDTLPECPHYKPGQNGWVHTATQEAFFAKLKHEYGEYTIISDRELYFPKVNMSYALTATM